MQKLNPNDIKDICHVTEILESTGEVTEYTKALYTDEKIAKDSQIKQYILSKKESHTFINEELGHFYFYFYTKMNDLEDLSNQYKVRYIMLATYLEYGSNKLVGKESGKGNINLKLTKKDLKIILTLSDSEFLKTIKALEEYNLVYELDGGYYLNNDYCIKGENINKKDDYTRVFINTFRNLYWNTKSMYHKQLYTFFLLIPYINIQSNIICKNVDEESIKQIIPINTSNMAEVLGVAQKHSSRLYNDLRRFKINEEYVIGKFDIGGVQSMIINPKVYYSGDNIDRLQYIIGLFTMAKNMAK